MTTILDGRVMATTLRTQLTARATELRTRGCVPTFALVLLGDDPAAQSYSRGIERAAAAVGVSCLVQRLPSATTQSTLTAALDGLSADPTVHGLVVQRPLPPGFDSAVIGSHVAVSKDIDGLNPLSAGLLLLGLPSYVPATAAAVREMLHQGGIALRGAHAVVVGRSATVGKPLALLLLGDNATVTVCHSQTVALSSITRAADIVVAAIGRPLFIGAEAIKPGATVIDVGINAVDGAIVGDVDYAAVAPLAGAISPVPGGVGPLTTTLLLRQLLTAAERATQ